jgi:deazaflavin-dependent oxidoreductase (nitroreductase family)
MSPVSKSVTPTTTPHGVVSRTTHGGGHGSCVLRPGNVMRRFNKFIVNPLALWLVAHRRMYYVVLRHVGRRSGRPYATPVVATFVHERAIIPMTFGPGTDWCRNVLAAGGCTLRSGGTTYRLTAPQILAASTAQPLVPPLLAWACRLAGIRTYLSCRVVGSCRKGRGT